MHIHIQAYTSLKKKISDCLIYCILSNGEVIKYHKFISVVVIELSVRCLNTGPEDRLDPEEMEKGPGPTTPVKNHKLLYVSSEILVYGPPQEAIGSLRVQLLLEGDPYGPLLNTLMTKKVL